MKVLYVAGPYRGATAWEIESNIREAERVSLELWKKHYAVICPHTTTRFFFGELEETQVLQGCLALLSRVDGIVLLPGWERSEGSRIEHAEALRRGIPIWFGADNVPVAEAGSPPEREDL